MVMSTKSKPNKPRPLLCLIVLGKSQSHGRWPEFVASDNYFQNMTEHPSVECARAVCVCGTSSNVMFLGMRLTPQSAFATLAASNNGANAGTTPSAAGFPMHVLQRVRVEQCGINHCAASWNPECACCHTNIERCVTTRTSHLETTLLQNGCA
eukprot:3114119-Amphidinium_carterae.1